MNEEELKKEELRKKRIANLRPWVRGSSGNPKGRPKLKSYKELVQKWLTLPLEERLTAPLADTFDLDRKQLENLTIQEYFFLCLLKAGMVECQKETLSYFKIKDLNQTLMNFVEKNGITDNESSKISQMFDLEDEEIEQLKHIFKKKLIDKDSEDQHKKSEEENE